MTEQNQKFMTMAIRLAQKGMDANAGGPFGCVIVKDGEIIGSGYNQVTATNDPTAHAEMVAIRKACKNLDSFQLEECTIYTSCEPCPMCLGAIYWARPKKVFFGADRTDAAHIHFDDQLIYDEIDKPHDHKIIPFEQILQPEAQKIFDQWNKKPDKTAY